MTKGQMEGSVFSGEALCLVIVDEETLAVLAVF